jgi:hypothetical protein
MLFRTATLSVAATVSILCAGSPGARGFALFPDPRTGAVVTDLEFAARWSPEPDPFGYGTGFHDGLQVAVASDFAAKLQVTAPEDIDLLRQVIRAAFEAWQTPELRFDINFERVPVEGTSPDIDSGYEIDLFAVRASHPALRNTNYFGVTFPHTQFAAQRLLSNGQRFDGLVITAVDIFINVDLVLELASLLPPAQRPAALQRLLMHEIGHGIGLGHPNTYSDSNANFDTDLDPFDPMPIRPDDPFAGIMYSPNRNAQAIMSNDRSHVGAFMLFTELQNDDRGGRDVLYPSLISCPGDCNGDGRVTIAELLTTVNVALGTSALAACLHADRDHDSSVSVDELISAVNTALYGCH